MSDIEIRIADESQVSEISEFVCQHFNGHEPIQLFHVRKEEMMDPPPSDMLRDSVESKTTLLAYKEGELVGVLIAGLISSDVAKKDLEYAELFGPKGNDVFEFLSYIGETADVCGRLNVSHCLHIHILSTHMNHLRQGIAAKLFEYCHANGQSKHFPALSVDATSFYTKRIAERFNMKCINTLTYEEYNVHIGKKLFEPIEPHHEIKTYAKIY